MADKVKILIVGDVCGNFKQFFQRITLINKKNGPFEIVCCVGDFFSSDPEQNKELIPYQNQTKKIPVPIFILGPTAENLVTYYKDIVDGEICANLTYLGKRGVYTLSSGIRIAYLSGLEKLENKSDILEEYYFNKEDVIAICNSCDTNNCDYRGVDILLTSTWPKGVRKEEVTICSKLVALLCKNIIPRYHFSGLNGEYYESKQFRIASNSKFTTNTRFVALADVGNVSKEKYIFALSITPISKMGLTDLIQVTTDEEPSPYDNLGDIFVDKNTIVTETNKTQYFFDMEPRNETQIPQKRQFQFDCSANLKKAKITHVNPETCWFCLSRSETEKQLIMSVGEHFYLALDKGPVNEYHVLILSITHIPAVSQLPDDAWPELLLFKNALKQFFHDQEKVVCFTERNYKSSHLQINVFGIDKSHSEVLKETFESFGENYNLEFQTLDSPLTSSKLLPTRGPYFVVELPNDTTLLTRQMKKFPINFAREVICSKSLLDCEQKILWRQCLLNKDEETRIVKEFSQKFNKYDFTK